MEYLPLLGVLIVIIGFALKWNPMLVVVVAMFVAGFAGNMNPLQIFQAIGSSFILNRSMALFILILPVIGLLEKNGLREVAAKLIHKIKAANIATINIAYTIFSTILGAFNVGVGGVVGFVRPVIYPMAEASIAKTGLEVQDEDKENAKGVSAAAANFSNFFSQCLFIGGPAMLLVQGTLAAGGYKLTFAKAALAELPVTIAMLIVTSVFYVYQNRKIMKNYPTSEASKISEISETPEAPKEKEEA